jgi:hypothetical protein
MNKPLAALLALTLLCSGCFRTIVRTDEPTTWRPNGGGIGVSFFWGLTPFETGSMCRNGIARAESFFPWWSIIISGVTAGLVTPLEVRYWCRYPPPGYGAPPPGAPVPPPPAR